MAKKSFRKVLSVRQPWAWLIVHGYKDIENRSWRSNYRGECFIHAPQAFDSGGYKWVRRRFPKIKMPQPSEFERGGIIGKVEIVDCVSRSSSPWFAGPFGYVVAAARPVPFVPARGRLGFFNLPDPVRILLRVEPDTLLVNDPRTGDVSVMITNLDRIPIEGISVTGRTKPRSLGTVSAFDDTDSNGETTAVWHAGNRKGRGVLIVRTEDGDEAEVPVELIRPPKVRDPKSGGDKEEDEEPEEPEEGSEEEPNGPDDQPPGPDEPEPEPPQPDGKEPPSDHPEPPSPQRPDHGTKGGRTPHGAIGNRQSPLDLTDLGLDDDDDDDDEDGGEPGDKDLGSGG